MKFAKNQSSARPSQGGPFHQPVVPDLSSRRMELVSNYQSPGVDWGQKKEKMFEDLAIGARFVWADGQHVSASTVKTKTSKTDYKWSDGMPGSLREPRGIGVVEVD